MWGFYMTEIEKRNLNLMLNSINYKKTDMGRRILNLAFLSNSKLFKLLLSISSDSTSFKYMGRSFQFKRLSDTLLVPLTVREDLKNNKKKGGESIPRILRLATNEKLLNPKLLVCYDTDLLLFVSFCYDENVYVIDYFNDIIMNKDDYFYICKTEVINEVGFRSIYELFDIIKEHDFFISFLYFLLFPDDIIPSVNRYELISNGKYSKNGINLGNYAIIGDSCDDIFLLGNDKFRNHDLEEIEDYTIDLKETDHIKCLGENHLFKDDDKEFTFMLFSDIVTDQELANVLCSMERYQTCHINSWKYVTPISETFSNAKVRIVGGKYLINDVDYYYHTWIELEIEGKEFVVDYTKNLIILKEHYYRLTGAEVINVVEEDDIKSIIDYVKGDILKLNPMDYSYFAQELLRDLDKNKHILKR